MILVDKIKTLNDKIKANRAQYSLGRKAANISALSSGKFNKYEYLTGEELIPKSRSIEKTCFEYFQVSQIFIKWLEEEEKEEDKKHGLLKKLKDIEYKTEEQLKAIQNQEDKQAETIEKFDYHTHNSLSISKQKEICNKSLDKRFEEIVKLNKKADPNYLMYKYKSPTADKTFTKFDNAITFLDRISKSESK